MKPLTLEQYKESLISMDLCPYCYEEVELEPTSMCCSEVHGAPGYEDIIGERGMLEDIESMYEIYLLEVKPCKQS